MSWASHPTSEMAQPSHSGRHRRRGPGSLAVLATVGLLAGLVGVAMFSPTLLGWPTPVPTTTPPSTVAVKPAVAPTGATPSAAPTTPAASPSATPTTTPSRTSSSGLAGLEDEVLARTNAERAKRGCNPLKLDANLRTAARNHSNDMVNNGYFSHTSPDGRGPGERMRDAGYNTDRGWAENIARGYSTVDAVMAGWMGSDGHRANILNCSMRSIGVGAVRAGNGRLYWTQDFGGR